MTTLLSHRGHPLVLTNGVPSRSTITVELYEKWYGLFIVHRDGSVEKIPFPDEPEYCHSDESPYVDHVPNPKVVARYAQINDYHVDNLAIELIVGRWEIQAKNRYF